MTVLNQTMDLATVMQVVAWISLAAGLLISIRTVNRSSQADQVQLENRLTKIESTLSNINQAIVEGQLIARVNDIDSRLKTIEDRGCKHAHDCDLIQRSGK